MYLFTKLFPSPVGECDFKWEITMAKKDTQNTQNSFRPLSGNVILNETKWKQLKWLVLEFPSPVGECDFKLREKK